MAEDKDSAASEAETVSQPDEKVENMLKRCDPRPHTVGVVVPIILLFAVRDVCLETLGIWAFMRTVVRFEKEGATREVIESALAQADGKVKHAVKVVQRKLKEPAEPETKTKSAKKSAAPKGDAASILEEKITIILSR